MKSDILKIRVDITSSKKVIKQIFHWIGAETKGKYICVSNVHMCMEAFDDSAFCNVVNNADLVVPDGKPLVWAQKFSGHKNAAQVRGPELFIKLCEDAQNRAIPIGLYGGSKKSLVRLMEKLEIRFPSLDITFADSPPFRELTVEEENRYIKEINSSAVKILFVGIGCPKQEKWMAKHKKNLNCVMIGVGAAFDFFSGEKKHAPVWMQKIGMEWFFRLISDPKRLWKRYLKHNPRFVYYFLKQLLKNKNNRNIQ